VLFVLREPTSRASSMENRPGSDESGIDDGAPPSPRFNREYMWSLPTSRLLPLFSWCVSACAVLLKTCACPIPCKLRMRERDVRMTGRVGTSVEAAASLGSVLKNSRCCSKWLSPEEKWASRSHSMLENVPQSASFFSTASSTLLYPYFPRTLQGRLAS
jgi:hypothetical protein